MKVMVEMHENRATRRHDFDLVQQIAVSSGGCMPGKEDLRPVHFIDLSTNGFAFVNESVPESEQLVVALNNGHSTIYLSAVVTNTVPLEIDDRMAYRVGCQFTGRVQWSGGLRQFLREGDMESALDLLANVTI